jgi:hypothetical protein
VNVPFPPFCAQSGRNVDVVLVMDTSMGAKGAEELVKALDLGLVGGYDREQIVKADFSKERVQVFKSTHPHEPILVYGLANTYYSTYKFFYNKNEAADVRHQAFNVACMIADTLKTQKIGEL